MRASWPAFQTRIIASKFQKAGQKDLLAPRLLRFSLFLYLYLLLTDFGSIRRYNYQPQITGHILHPE